MRKIVRVLPLFALALAIQLQVAYAETSVAAILPLTGNAADQGEWARRGFEIAKAEVIQSNKFDIRMIYEDSKGGNPATAVQVYRSVQLRAKVPVVFTYGSGVGMALSPLVNADRVIQMGIATATPKYTSAEDFTFRNFPSAILETEFLAKMLISNLGFKKLSILNIESDYGVGTAAAFKSAFTQHGGKIFFEDSYSPGDTDFRSLLLKLKASESQAVYLAAFPSYGALILKQAREIKISQQFVGSVAIIGGKDFFQLAGDAAEGLLVASSVPAGESNFSREYERQYPGEAPAQRIYAARAYDAFKVVAGGLENCADYNTECLKTELFKVRDYPGASGTFSFDRNGDVKSAFALFRIRRQSFEAVH